MQCSKQFFVAWNHVAKPNFIEMSPPQGSLSASKLVQYQEMRGSMYKY